MNTFVRESQAILKARFRAKVGAIAITLDTDEERTMFVSPAALEEAIGSTLRVNDIRMLAGGRATYHYSHVVNGEEFTWTKQDNAEVMVCNREDGLDIYNIIAITFPNDPSRDMYFQDNCVAKATEEDYELAKAVRAEKRNSRNGIKPNEPVPTSPEVALRDTINGLTKLAELKAMAGEYDEFATVLEEVLKATTVNKARSAMLSVLNLPF